MSYGTGNAMPSKDPRDLYDNATTFDKLSTGSEKSYPDRFGVPRLSLAGYGMVFDESQLARDASFQAFLLAAGYVWIGDYAAGITFTARNQYTVRAGSTYRVAPGTSIPYTLTGDWATDQPKLVLLETAGTILTQLGANAGAGLIGTTESITVQAALDARLKSNINLGSTNLNTLYTSSSIGVYRQSVDASATLALNYPLVGVGGTLEVYIGSGNLALQEFTSKTLRKLIRWCSSATGPTWTAWREISLPLGGIPGQSLINSADGVGVWGNPTIVDTNTAPGVRVGLFIRYGSSNHIEPITVLADYLSVTNSLHKSILLPAFNQSAQQGSATTGLNSLDSGTWTGGEYHLFAIYNPTTEVRGLLWSKSRTAPTLPSGFTHKTLVSTNLRNTTGNLTLRAGVQTGNNFTVNNLSLNSQILTSGVIGSISATAATWVLSSFDAIAPSNAIRVRVTAQAIAGTMAVSENSGNPPSLTPHLLSTMTRVVNNDKYVETEWFFGVETSPRSLYVAASAATCTSWVTGWELSL